MKKTLKNIIQKDDNNYGLEIWNQNIYMKYTEY